MTQIVIDIGAVPNDGTGDPLRTAFNDVNLNFANVFAAGPVDSNIQIVNNRILTVNTNGNLVLNPNGIGVVQANAHVVPDQYGIRNLGSSSKRWGTIYTQYLDYQGANISYDNLAITGNIIAGGFVSAVGNVTGNYLFGNGNQLTGINKIANGNSYANIASADGNLVINVGTDGYGTWTFETGTGNLIGPGNISQGAGIVLSAEQSVYIREDMGQLNIDAFHTVITSNSGNVGNTQSWDFDNAGNLTAPGNILMSNISGIYSSSAGYVVGLQMSNTEPSVKLVANDHEWMFDPNGVLKFPAGYSTTYPAITMGEPGNLLIQGYLNSNFSEDGGNIIVSGGFGDGNNGNATVFGQQVTVQAQLSLANGSPTYSWAFGADGSTIFPTLTTQRGDNPSGTIQGQTLLFGDATQEAIISTADGTANNENSQRLVINPGQGYDYGEGGDIYLWAGRGGDGSGSGGDIKIRGGQGGANTSGGTGGDGGYIRIEAGDSATTGGAPGYIDINAGINYLGAGGYVDIQGGQGHTIGGDANITGGYGYNVRGGNVNIWGGGSANGQSNEGHVNIQTGGNTWTFDPSGNLSIPGNILGSGNILIAPDSASASSYLDIYLTGGPDIHIAGNDNSIVIGRDTGANVFVGNDGEVSIRTDNGATPQVWNFTDTGNLTLPGNTFAVNYANGDPVIISGGTANTGNVTFSDQIVIGTGISNLVSGLYLAPSSSSANAVQYLRVRGDVSYEPTHIHFDTGNNQYFNQFIGDDNKYVLLSNTGNIVINTDNYVGNSAQWTFDTFGNLTVPDTTTITANVELNLVANSDSNISGLLVNGDSNANLYAHTNVVIYANSSGPGNTWTFDNTGNTTFPNGAVFTGYDLYAAANSYVELAGDTGNTYIGVGQNSAFIQTDWNGAQKEWGFLANGVMTAPGAISAVGNITGGNITTAGLISATGNITGGNISTGTVTLTNGATIKNTAGNAIAIGYLAGNTSQGSYATAIGFGAGGTSQGTDAIAIGGSAGSTSQGNYGVSIGYLAGQTSQGNYGVSIGRQAGFFVQGISSVAVGYLAGNTTQGNNSVAMGRSAGETTQGEQAVAIGLQAGFTAQGNYAVAIGKFSANSNQGTYAVAVGPNAGFENQLANAVAIGSSAGASSQGINSVAVGVGAAYNTQGNNAVAVGSSAAYLLQGINSVAIGVNAGIFYLGTNSIAIGANAGNNQQGNNSIVFNATGSNLRNTTANTFTVAPVRNDNSNIAEVMFYNTTSKEVTYGNTISVAGNVTAANFFGNGNTLSNVATQVIGSWTVPTGNSTQSFTVTPNETYYMWVDCNIPNGILAWNATATVTNTNVPVVGAQYAWVYNGGGTPIDFTSIPNQFIGTSNTIVRSSVAPSATTNRFDFGINNTSGNSQTVRYGWTAIS